MDVPGVDVKVDATADLTPAVKAGSDIATNTHKGVSKLFYALCGPWMEGRVRKAELIAAQTSKDCTDIKNGLVTYTGENVIPFEPQTTVASSFEALHKLNHASDAKRLHAAMQEAARQILEVPEEQVSDEPLSQDFFNHWRREAEMIDDEALRQWWARLLVEETKAPKSISPRTLDVVKNLSKNEAEVFKTLVRGEVDGTIPIDAEGRPQFGNYEMFLQMTDAGLLLGSEASRKWNGYKQQNGERTVIINPLTSDYAICANGESYGFDCYSLTTAGRQLANIVRPHRTLEDVKEIIKFLAGTDKSKPLAAHKILSVKPDVISYSTKPAWTLNIVTEEVHK